MAAPDPHQAADPDAVKRHPALFRAIRKRKNPRLRRTDITVTDDQAVKRAVKAASLGNAMEWFDFGIYSYLAVTIGHVFFPSGNDTTQLLSSFATFAVAFLVRPLGGMFFGPMGDKIGRKKVLALTMILMAIGTFAIGVIPSHDTIGLWAPALLILFRMLQGFSTGGEYGGASTFIAEYAPDKRRGFFGSFLEFGTLAGYVGAAGLVTALYALLDTGQMESWGWRIPFLVAGPLGLVGLYLRLRLDETPAFQKLEGGTAHATEAADHVESTAKGDLAKIFRQYWPTLILCIALVGAYNITDYMLLSYMPTYLSDELGYSETHGLLILLAVMIFLMLVISQFGKLSDRFGRKPLLMGRHARVPLPVPAVLPPDPPGQHPGDHHRHADDGPLPGLHAGHDVRRAPGPVPDQRPLRLPVGGLQHLGLALRRYDPAGDHGPDQLDRLEPDARVLRDGGGAGGRDRGGLHEGNRQPAAGKLPALGGDGGGSGGTGPRAEPGPEVLTRSLHGMTCPASVGTEAGQVIPHLVGYRT